MAKAPVAAVLAGAVDQRECGDLAQGNGGWVNVLGA